MDDTKMAVAILGVVVIIAIIGLVFMFSMAKTGASVGGIYTNYEGDPFPYSRFTEKEPVIYERPAATISGELPAARTYAGASEFFQTGTEKGVKTTFTTYKRSAETDIPTAQTTGVAIRFAGGVRAPYCYGQQLYYAKAAVSENMCFTHDEYGRAINDLLPQYYGCCIR